MVADERFDIAIVGAGIVGLATARELLTRRPGLRVGVLDKEPAIAQHQTGHNSGVIHAGVYYAPGSLKARACVAGKAKLIRFCEEHRIPYELCGKVIVATEESELPRLHELYKRGQANGVPGLELIGPRRLRELEPHVEGIQALYSPTTGIVDFGRVAHACADEVQARGGTILTGHEVIAITQRDGLRQLVTPVGTIEARVVITCAGVYADRVARLTGAPESPKIVPFRGDYYVLRPERAGMVRSLIYPVPDPRFPFLGVHFTRRIDGSVWLGPNAVLAFSREGYRFRDVNLRDLKETLAFPGFRKLARRYWRTGGAEMYRDLSKRSFLKELQRYMPDLRPDDLLPGPSGVRAQALAPDGSLVDDFVVDRQEGALHVRNAPSPAATSSLAIAELIADAVEETTDLGPARV
ncbi:L-2-hydroxyglutarate oxidase [Sphaerobacter thermophilus]|uniref:2-hydroxyglutarate dehydrogenase n=1 Tax=Sphaerobacter thermophilus (strain ATCC 49802 / DSM 20745 / KCCM 41009 / NCIMB 13125 / S 6022) TaxID=479434 RepID=D1C4X4_SPHTD|nr:L-2-hydroxyglutarate oxidase [Sphaerobacter thermophilus]ACZ39291.1 2-hydroxyglutarate dehydrogenase [Sphaerobacter thermophilus DSM 20745]